MSIDQLENRKEKALAVLRMLAGAQGIYFFVTGLWPLLSIGTFQIATGPKIDLWLVKTVGVLVAVIGGCLLSAAWRRNFTQEFFLLSLGSALGLTAIDVIYVLDGTLPPIYLADAALEVLLVIFVSFFGLRAKGRFSISH